MRHSYCTVVRDPSTLSRLLQAGTRVLWAAFLQRGRTVKVTGIVLLTFGGTDLDDAGGLLGRLEKQSK